MFLVKRCCVCVMTKPLWHLQVCSTKCQWVTEEKLTYKARSAATLMLNKSVLDSPTLLACAWK